MSLTDDTTTIENRSEIVFLYDAQDTNPNGNPLSANDRPRVDEGTGEAVVTDVRLKRYLRDQLDDDGHGIYIRNPSKAPYDGAPGRDELFTRVTGLEEEDVEDVDGEDAAAAFLESAADVRYFGATCSFSSDFQKSLGDGFPGQFIGPVQFSHGRSLNEVVLKSEAKQLSTVVGSGEDEEQGTFATDNRLQYAMVRFHGVVNENGADMTQLSPKDVERLDSLTWRALKNQTLTRSKMGHHPRLYVRVEYETDNYHVGTLDDGVELHPDSEPDAELRNVTDVVLDASGLVQTLKAEAEAGHIETVHVVGDEYLELVVDDDGTRVHGDDLADNLGEELKSTTVSEVSIYSDRGSSGGIGEATE